MQIQYRRATVADIDHLLSLMHDFYAEAGFALDATSTAPALRTLLSDPALGAIWLAWSQGRPVGHAVLTVRFTMEHEGLSGYIDDLFVVKSHRRLGIAARLLSDLTADCRARGCKALQVEVGESNRAGLGLYAKLGLRAPTDDRILLRGQVPGI